MRKIKNLVLHHSLTETGDVESFRKYHIEKLGWKDVGYHYVINKKGELQKGREEETVGAHVRGHNQNTVGICLTGNFNETIANEEQLKTLKELLADLLERYDLDLDSIKLHRDFLLTDDKSRCPGRNFDISDLKMDLNKCGIKTKVKSELEEIRKSVNKIEEELKKLMEQ